MDTPGVVTPGPWSGLFSLPSTRLGKWSAGLLAASIVAVLVNTLVVMPWTEQTTGLDLAQNAVNLSVFVCMAAAGLTGLVAVISKHERSWFAFLAILLLGFALAMNIAELL